MTLDRSQMFRLLASTVVFAIAFALRLGAINGTVINTPIRADGLDYYRYAVNLKTYGTYSRAHTFESAPEPDALRPPGYPVFLLPFVEEPPTAFMLWQIGFAHALLDAFSVLLAISVFRRFLPETAAVGAGILTALSPHLISASTYLLTETLFTFLLMLSRSSISRARLT